MKLLVTGTNDQLGMDVCALLQEKKKSFIGTNKDNLDITNQDDVKAMFEKEKPDVIFHCEAYTSVDAAEENAKVKNYLINETGTKHIAEAAKSIKAKVVYISTDYVFDGSKPGGSYLEDDKTNPINEFGKAKLLGEEAIQKELSDFYIVRGSWLFGTHGNNFVNSTLALSETFDTIPAVIDRIGCPTWTRSLAEFMLYLVENDCEYGIYHFSNAETCNRFEFAAEILKETKAMADPIKASQYLPYIAKRPENTTMDLSKAKATGFEMMSWKEALEIMMETTPTPDPVATIPETLLEKYS